MRRYLAPSRAAAGPLLPRSSAGCLSAHSWKTTVSARLAQPEVTLNAADRLNEQAWQSTDEASLAQPNAAPSSASAAPARRGKRARGGEPKASSASDTPAERTGEASSADAAAPSPETDELRLRGAPRGGSLGSLGSSRRLGNAAPVAQAARADEGASREGGDGAPGPLEAIFESLRLCQLSPHELAQVSEDGVVPMHHLLRAYRLLHLVALDTGRQLPAVTERLQSFRRPSDLGALDTHTEGRHVVRLQAAEPVLRAIHESVQRDGKLSGARPSLALPQLQLQLPPVTLTQGGRLFTLTPQLGVGAGGGAELQLTVVHASASGLHGALGRSFRVGVVLARPSGLRGVHDVLTPQPPPVVGLEHRDQLRLKLLPLESLFPPEPSGPGGDAADATPPAAVASAAASPPRARGGSGARDTFFLPNGDLPLTLTLQELVRDRPDVPVRHGRARPINGRPTSIQVWQFEKERLRHWAHGIGR